MEKLITSATTVVLIWGAFNTTLAVMLAGFTASSFDGGAGPAGFMAFGIYAASATLVFLTALAVWIGRRRRRGLNEPPRAAAAVLLALGVGMAWTGLAVGEWAAYLGAAVVLAGAVYEFYPRMRP
jgi:hypothetical protein